MSQTESGVAEQMVGMSIRAMESLSRLLASGAKNLAVFLFSIAKGTKQYRGITSVKNLLDGGHELATLELSKAELREFCIHAKKNDIPCTIIHDKKLYQDTVPVLVRKVDAERVNRVVERMRLQQLPEDRGMARDGHTAPSQPVNPTTGRRISRSRPRSRFRPSEGRSNDRGSTGSISLNRFRPSVHAKILHIRRERQEAARAAQPQVQQMPAQAPVQAPAWNALDDQMMEVARAFLLALTKLTQEVTQQPARQDVRQAIRPVQTQQTAHPARESRQPTQERPFRSGDTGQRQSAKGRMEQAKSARAARPAPAQPSRSAKVQRGGR